MTDFRERFKRVGFGREDVDVNRVLRSQRREESRHEQRSVHYNRKRDIEDDSDNDSFFEPELVRDHDNTQEKELQQDSPKDAKKKAAGVVDIEVAVQQRLLELEKWKEERARKKIQEKKNLKPAFKVGVVHHRIYSPPLNKNSVPVPPTKLCKSKDAQHEEQQPPKRVTRATEKRLAAKAITNHQRREDFRNKKKQALASDKNEKKAQLAPQNYKFKAPMGVTPLPAFGRMAFKDSKENIDSCNTLTVTSSISEFGENLSSLSDSVFLSSTKFSNTSEIKGGHSNLTSATNNKISHDLVDNSSVETKSEKLSSQDQEVSSNPEEIEFKKILLSPPRRLKSSTIKRTRRSTRKSIIKPSDVEPMIIDSSETVLQDQTSVKIQNHSDDMNNGSALKNIDKGTNKRKSYGTRRSKKIFENQTASPTKSKDVSFTQTNTQDLSNVENIDFHTENENSIHTTSAYQNIKNEVIEEPVIDNSCIVESQLKDNLSMINSKLKTTTLDSPMLLSKPVKAVTKRSSIKSVKLILKDDATQKIQSNISCNQEKEQLIAVPGDTNVSKLNTSEFVGNRKSARFTKSKSAEIAVETSTDPQSTDSKLSRPSRKSSINRKSSKRALNDENIPVDSPMNEVSSYVNDQEVPISRESVFDLQNKHLLDITHSDLNKFKALKKNKHLKIDVSTPMSIQDQSLIKFSPRQSLRLQKEKKKPQAILMEVDSTTETPESGMADRCLTEFDPLVNENLNESTSSEPTIRRSSRSPNLSQDSQLNLTQLNESSSEKPPAFYSPFVVTSRGKSNIRKEVQKRRFSHHLGAEDVPTKDTIMQSLNISVEEEERTAQYYKYILDKEIERLNELCANWNMVKEAEATPEEASYWIQAAVGHTQLLINKKFERFRGLVLDCETGKGEMLVTCKDLQGFWEMMYMEIRDVDSRFNKLKELEKNNWVEDEIEEKVEVKPKKKLVPVKKPVVKKKPAAKSSSIRAHIMAARKKMENKDDQMDVNMEIDVKEPSNNEPQVKIKVDRQNGVPSMRNSRRFSTPKTLANDRPTPSGRKSLPVIGSPLIMMKVSQMCKTPEVRLDGSIVYINSDQTPAKSILKDKTKEDVNGFVAKSKNKVLFKTQHAEIQEYITREDDSRNSNEFNESDKEPVERKLDFEEDNLSTSPVDEAENNKDQVELRHQLFLGEDGVVCEKFLPVTPQASVGKRRNSERSNKSPKSDEIKKLNISIPSTLRPRRQAKQTSDIEFDDSPFQADRFPSDGKKVVSTPRTRQSLKRRVANAELSDDETAPTATKSPKVSRKTPKVDKIRNSTNISDQIEQSATPRLRRAKSLNFVEEKNSENQSQIKTRKSSLRRTISKIKADSKENHEKTMTPKS
ncbi:uncharacterized protein LOC106636922 [Copidosoma floridanum]|uniref:uncharacterized protein LOC106636922 n=1 Tax=Copidosoma floridanum TaxID=29053 RepID=UPI0006C9CFFE|nr:uncharacterized protein LOC106636922 [Copidosoma floridanum]